MPDPFGLNDTARLAHERASARKQQQLLNPPGPARLNPPWPYTTRPFDALFFNLDQQLPTPPQD